MKWNQFVRTVNKKMKDKDVPKDTEIHFIEAFNEFETEDNELVVYLDRIHNKLVIRNAEENIKE